MTRHDNYGVYDGDNPVYRPFSKHLQVEQGEKPKGRAKPNTIVSMEALPDFISRMKPHKVGKHKKHLDIGIENDSAAELADEGESMDAQDRHIASILANDPDSDGWDL